MLCPVCEVPLIAVERDQIEVDSCPSCRGLWFDRGELELLCERSGASSVPRFEAAISTEKTRHCPRCRRKMAKVALAANPRIVTDQCPEEHGIWFDARELGTVIDHAGRPGADNPPLVQFLGETFRSV